MDNKFDERPWVREEALAVLETTAHVISGISWPCPKSTCDTIPECFGRKVIDPWTLAFAKWGSLGCPILTDRTKDILKEVEEAMKECETCNLLNKCAYRAQVENVSINYKCPLVGIRHAYEKGERK